MRGEAGDTHSVAKDTCSQLGASWPSHRTPACEKAREGSGGSGWPQEMRRKCSRERRSRAVSPSLGPRGQCDTPMQLQDLGRVSHCLYACFSS